MDIRTDRDEPQEASKEAFSGQQLAQELQFGAELQRPNPVVNLVEREQWGKNTVKYRMHDENGIDLGYMEVRYDPADYEDQLNTIFVDSIHVVNTEYQGQGYGEAAYKQVPNLQPPDGLRPGEYHFQSSDQLSDSARKAWARLVDQGLAVQTDRGYEYLQTIVVQ